MRTVPAQPQPVASTLLARQPGFSLHAATCCEANQRDKLEKLCRYIARPAIANERLSTNERGQIVYQFKQPFRNGTTHVVLEPLELMAHTHVRHPTGDLRSSKDAALAAGLRHRSERGPIKTCPKCGGKLRVIACIEDPDVIATILEHIQRREAAAPSQPRAPPRRSEHLDTPNQDRLF